MCGFSSSSQFTLYIWTTNLQILVWCSEFHVTAIHCTKLSIVTCHPQGRHCLFRIYSSDLQISYPYSTPSSEIPSAVVDKPLGAAQGTNETDSMPDEHYLYSLKDFQPFESKTYRGEFFRARHIEVNSPCN